MLSVNSERPVTKSMPAAHDWKMSVLHGSESILRMQDVLVELSDHCGQAGAMDHLEYFLRRPKFASKIPCLILFSTRQDGGLPTGSNDLVGAVLLYQYQVAGIGCRIFVADYHAGDRTVVAPAGLRSQIASLTCAGLLERGALVAQLTYQVDVPDSEVCCDSAGKNSSWWRWASTVRVMHGHIPLAETYDETLAGLGKHTRRNLRASRRHAKEALGYTFVDEPVVTKEEYIAFNHISTHPVSDAMAAWRYEAMKLLPQNVFLGIRAGSGEWLSLIGGRRSQDRTIIEWQMNRIGMRAYSLSTLMRSHLLEYEVERGSKRLYLVGGTSHSMKASQAVERFVDLVSLRYPLPTFFLRRFARPLMLEQAFLVHTLGDPNLKWNKWNLRTVVSADQ